MLLVVVLLFAALSAALAFDPTVGACSVPAAVGEPDAETAVVPAVSAVEVFAVVVVDGSAPVTVDVVAVAVRVAVGVSVAVAVAVTVGIAVDVAVAVGVAVGVAVSVVVAVGVAVAVSVAVEPESFAEPVSADVSALPDDPDPPAAPNTATVAGWGTLVAETVFAPVSTDEESSFDHESPLSVLKSAIEDSSTPLTVASV